MPLVQAHMAHLLDFLKPTKCGPVSLWPNSYLPCVLATNKKGKGTSFPTIFCKFCPGLRSKSPGWKVIYTIKCSLPTEWGKTRLPHAGSWLLEGIIESIKEDVK